MLSLAHTDALLFLVNQQRRKGSWKWDFSCTALFSEIMFDSDEILLELFLPLTFHMSNRGTFDIYVKCDGVGRCVGNYDNRGSFGELALMYNTPRAATITATSPGALWGLVSEIFT